MAIRKRVGKNNNISYQVKIHLACGRWIIRTFKKKREAELFEMETKIKTSKHYYNDQLSKTITTDELWNRWCLKCRHNTSDGWKLTQNQMYRDYIRPLIGKTKLNNLNSMMIKELFESAENLGRSPQTINHIYDLINKLFNDAVEELHYIEKSPVKKSHKPIIPKKEVSYLSLNEIHTLTKYIEDKKYGLAINLQLICGLRVGEVQV